MAAAKQTGMPSTANDFLLPFVLPTNSLKSVQQHCAMLVNSIVWSGHRDYSLRRVATQKGILLTTYGMVLHNSDALSLRRITRLSSDHNSGAWDFMILDEVRMCAVLTYRKLPSQDITH